MSERNAQEDCCIPNHGCDHSCAADKCRTDARSEQDVWAEGYAAFGNGATYSDAPYGHHHPDVRFNWWVRGWAEARYVVGQCRWCDKSRTPRTNACRPCRRADLRVTRWLRG